MMPKVAGEVLAYCTKCRMDLMHVVVSMDGEVIAKTQCKSCGGVHLYRAPKSHGNATHSTKVLNRRKSAGSSEKTKAGSRKHKESNNWKALISAHEEETPRAYRLQDCFTEGDLILHSIFGTGVVIHVPAPEKMTVQFEEGIKMLAQGR
jgi:hypothetical protein